MSTWTKAETHCLLQAVYMLGYTEDWPCWGTMENELEAWQQLDYVHGVLQLSGYYHYTATQVQIEMERYTLAVCIDDPECTFQGHLSKEQVDLSTSILTLFPDVPTTMPTFTDYAKKYTTLIEKIRVEMNGKEDTPLRNASSVLLDSMTSCLAEIQTQRKTKQSFDSMTREELLTTLNDRTVQVKQLRRQVDALKAIKVHLGKSGRKFWRLYEEYQETVPAKMDIIPSIFEAIKRGLSPHSLVYQFCLTQFKFWCCDNFKGNAIHYSPKETTFWYGLYNAFGKRLLTYIKGFTCTDHGFRTPRTEEEKKLPNRSPKLFEGEFILPGLATFQRMNANRSNDPEFVASRLKQVHVQFEYSRHRYESLKRQLEPSVSSEQAGEKRPRTDISLELEDANIILEI